MTGEAFDALFGFELEDFDLFTFDRVQNFGVDFDFFDDRSANSDVFAIDEEKYVKNEFFLFADELDIEEFIVANEVLFSAGGDNCLHECLTFVISLVIAGVGFIDN